MIFSYIYRLHHFPTKYILLPYRFHNLERIMLLTVVFALHTNLHSRITAQKFISKLTTTSPRPLLWCTIFSYRLRAFCFSFDVTSWALWLPSVFPGTTLHHRIEASGLLPLEGPHFLFLSLSSAKFCISAMESSWISLCIFLAALQVVFVQGLNQRSLFRIIIC